MDIKNLFSFILDILHLKINWLLFNLQYNTLVRWADGTNDSSTKHLTFQVFFFIFFKLADRMRSMRTNGASKNRDYCELNGFIFLTGEFSILYGMYTIWYVYVYLWYVYLWYVYLWYVYLWYVYLWYVY